MWISTTSVYYSIILHFHGKIVHAEVIGDKVLQVQIVQDILQYEKYDTDFMKTIIANDEL